MAVRVGLLHALQGSIAPLEKAFAHIWPEAEIVHLYDSSLYADYQAQRRVTPETAERIRALVVHLERAGARGILFSGSLFSRAVEKGRTDVRIPVLTAYEAMIEEAFQTGSRLGLLATFPDSIDALTSDIECFAEKQSVECSLESRLVEGAFDALQAGDRDRHDALIAAAAKELGGCDVLLLAQHSMSSAKERLASAMQPPILSSSETAARKLKRLVEGPARP